MQQNIYNAVIQQGATWQRVFTWKDAANALVNLTGFTARMMVREHFTSPSPAISITTTPNAQGSITLGGTAGTIAVRIEASATDELDAADYQYDLEVVAPDGTVTRFIEGKASVTAQATK